MPARTTEELKQIIRDKAAAGISLPDLKKTFAGEKLGSSTVGKIYQNNKPVVAPTPLPGGGGATGGGLSYNEQVSIFENLSRAQENLAHIQGGYSVQAAGIGANASVAAAGLRADADKEVARAYADAQRYGSELGLQGVKYGADKESEWRQAVANIEVKGKLDLQPIINAGLERVAGIEAQAQRDVAETTGKYGLESTRARTAADERIGKMQLAGSMYGLLGAAFG